MKLAVAVGDGGEVAVGDGAAVAVAVPVGAGEAVGDGVAARVAVDDGRGVGVTNAVAVGEESVGTSPPFFGPPRFSNPGGLGPGATNGAGARCGLKMLYHGNLFGAGQNDAANAALSSTSAANPTWSPSRLSFANVPKISPRSGSRTRRPLTLARLSRLCVGAEK